MSDLLVLGLRLLFLALLWLFVLFAVNVIRTDLFGRRVPASDVVAWDAAPPVPLTRPRGRAGRRLPSQLKITSGPRAGLTVPLGEGILIGRTPDALDLNDQFMSTTHATITLTPTGYVVEDLGSTNGTLLNESRIVGPTPLTRTDTLRIGRTTMTVDK